MSELQRFQLINKIEGISYILLLFIAMPLKYFGNLAVATKIMGSIHGFLFVVFCYQLYKIYKRSFISSREAILYFVLSLVPFGSFYTERLINNRLDTEPISIKDF